MPISCPACREPIPETAALCPYCGETVRGVAHPSPSGPVSPEFMPPPGMPPPLPPAMTSGAAIASLVLGILSMVSCLFFGPGAVVFGFPGVIFGHIGLIRTRPDYGMGGRGMAVAGLVLGYTAIALGMVSILFIGSLVLFASRAVPPMPVPSTPPPMPPPTP